MICSINISSIRIIETATNDQEIIQAITVFDNVLSNNISIFHYDNIRRKY